MSRAKRDFEPVETEEGTCWICSPLKRSRNVFPFASIVSESRGMNLDAVAVRQILDTNFNALKLYLRAVNILSSHFDESLYKT